MTVIDTEIINIRTEQDTILLRSRIFAYTGKIKMGLINQTKLLTAASELVRNMLRYANGGVVLCEVIAENVRKTGIRLTFTDKGPGIPDITQAMKDGFSTGKSLGIGLPGAKRLVSEFFIKSEIGVGTVVTLIKWNNV